MSSVGGEIGGKAAGGEDVNQQQYPFFTSPGGITSEQQSLAEYDYGQNLTAGQAQFGNSPLAGEGGGNALSTMASQVAGGANMGKALDLARMSDVNQGADYGAYQTAIGIDQANNASLLAEQQQNLQNATSPNTTQSQEAAGLQTSLSTPGTST
jgi:hypothetical protein